MAHHSLRRLHKVRLHGLSLEAPAYMSHSMLAVQPCSYLACLPHQKFGAAGCDECLCSPKHQVGGPTSNSVIAFCAAVTSSDLEYEGSESEPGYEPETDREDESEHSPKEGPHLTGVRL